jgi:hypothetical protein
MLQTRARLAVARRFNGGEATTKDEVRFSGRMSRRMAVFAFAQHTGAELTHIKALNRPLRGLTPLLFRFPAVENSRLLRFFPLTRDWIVAWLVRCWDILSFLSGGRGLRSLRRVDSGRESKNFRRRLDWWSSRARAV